MPEPRSMVDRPGPGIFDALRGDPSLYFDRDALRLLELDQSGFSHRFLRPFFRIGSRMLVALIVFIKRMLPFEFSNHDLLDRLGVWFMSRFVSRHGGELLLRHFVVETNVIAFIARNTGLTEATLRPTSLEQLTDNAVVIHDLNVYELLAGLEGKDLYQRGSWPLDYTMLHVPEIDASGERRWLKLDLESGLSCMNIAFALLTTNLEYQRAVHSLQLDESLLGCIAELTGDEAFRAWRPVGYALIVQTNRDVPRYLYGHAVVHEYIHARLIWHSKKAGIAERSQPLNESGPPQAPAPGGPTSNNRIGD
ncbi:MAG TPA: hypothetical protein VJQ79_05445 [Acidimicrobiia bacterium]|nr:hypothetical protein [Acidimicrobiia bacterium]